MQRLSRGLLVLVSILSSAPSAVTAPIFTNGIYQARVSSHPSAALGTWSAATDVAHPVGGGRDLLFVENVGDIVTTTNGSSLRVYNSLTGGITDYTTSGAGVLLDTYHVGDVASAFGVAGIQTMWELVPEDLIILQDVFLVGTSFETSAIYHTVEIQNVGDTARDIGWRNLYDWQVDDPFTDDGPNNSVENVHSGAVVAPTTREFNHTPAPGDFVRVGIDPGTASYEPLLGIGFDPGFVPEFPVTIPDAYAYARWPESIGTTFDYPALGFEATVDSAGLSWFGRTAATAITIGPNESTRITQVLFGVAPGVLPPPGVVFEPGSLWLLVVGLVGLATATRARWLDRGVSANGR